MISHGELALPDELASLFAEWLRRHDLHGRKPGFDVVTFDATGAALARHLQALVGPACTVRYAPTRPASLLGWFRSRTRR
jgi:hypothetical protein